MRRSMALFAGLLCFAPALARAASPADCPDGWFCDDEPPVEPGGPQEAPPPPPPPIRLDSEGDPREGREYVPPKPKRHRHLRRPEWGFNLHVEKALLGGDDRKRSPDASMDGIGLALRARLLPAFAVEAGADFLSGTDWQGYSRDEQALVFHALGFVNPRDRFQLYGFGGFGFSHANVTIRPLNGELPFSRYDLDYWYVGLDLGFGLSARVARRISIDADLLGLVRWRVDDNAESQPEFIDPVTHRATNISGAGLIRLGATFYW